MGAPDEETQSARPNDSPDDPRQIEPSSSAGRFLSLAADDITAALELPYATDDTMPGVLESKSLLTMTHLWDRKAWAAHKSELRWVPMLLHWPTSSILRAIRLPLACILLATMLVILTNRLLDLFDIPRFTLPLAPLSLQASSIGLLLVFRNNQTHDRLKEAQRALGGLGALAREVMQLLVVHSPMEHSRDVALAARLLALFGWTLRSQCRHEPEEIVDTAEALLPRAHNWLLDQEDRPAAVLLRLRAVIGSLRNRNALSSDAFKFIEERLAKLSAVDATCVRLATFPVPPSYHRHGSRAILVWLSSLPFVLEGLSAKPIQTFLCVATTTWLLLGIDQIAIEVEQPLDVLPLHVFASNMARDVRTVLASWTSMPSLPAPGDGYEDQLGYAREVLASPSRRSSVRHSRHSGESATGSDASASPAGGGVGAKDKDL